jgi:hypothetical protein
LNKQPQQTKCVLLDKRQVPNPPDRAKDESGEYWEKLFIIGLAYQGKDIVFRIHSL